MLIVYQQKKSENETQQSITFSWFDSGYPLRIADSIMSKTFNIYSKYKHLENVCNGEGIWNRYPK